MSKTTSTVVRNELSKYAQQIENLAKQVQTTLAAGGNPLTVAHELVRNSSTFVFVLGEMYALEEAGRTGRKVNKGTATVVSNPNNTSTAGLSTTATSTATTTVTPNYRHSKRDQSTGRFLKN